jgi:hypothetical protein
LNNLVVHMMIINGLDNVFEASLWKNITW